ncbi:hypothetical protein CR513_02336, partial [Mucuna pruriens]
ILEIIGFSIFQSRAPFIGQKDEVSKVSIPNSNASKSNNIKCFKCLRKGYIASQCPNKRTMFLRENGDIDNESSQEEMSHQVVKGIYSSEDACYEGDILMVRRLMRAFVLDDQSQRENIFHSRLSEHGEMIVDKHVSIAITLGKFKDEILCGVVSMECDRKVTHDGVANKFSFVHEGNKITLKPLTIKEVLED